MRPKKQTPSEDRFAGVTTGLARRPRLDDDLDVVYGSSIVPLTPDERARIAKAAARPGAIGWKGLTAAAAAAAERGRQIKDYSAEI